MTYMGSKNKYRNDIPPVINNYIKENKIKVFIDLTCGGANLTDKIMCREIWGNDLSPSLIALHKQAQEDFSLIPVSGNRDDWDKSYSAWKKLKKILEIKNFNEFTEDDFSLIGLPLYKIGCMEWYSSFARGGFSRGFASPTSTRNYYEEGRRNHKKQAESVNYKSIHFLCEDYRTVVNKFKEKENILFYIAPPYRGTKPYDIEKKFNYEAFYDFLRNIDKPIFVSEQFLPEEFEEKRIWSKEVKRTAGKDNNYKSEEKLWLIGDNK